MQIEADKLEHLLNSDSLTRVETQMVEKLGTSIYKDDLPLLIQLIKKEIDASEIPIDVIAEFIGDNEKMIVEFGLSLLNKKPNQMLCIGVSITYSIYLILLQRKDDTFLEQYLVKRRIPDSAKFFKQLKGIKITG